MERKVSLSEIMLQRKQESGADTSSTLRAFALLEQVARSAAPLSLDELTVASGLPKPTVHRILGLLREADLLHREPLSKRYVAGPRLTAFARDVLANNSPQRDQRHAILQRLVDEIGETCNFTMRDGDTVVYVDRVETPSPVRLHMDAGSRVPLHCTASGKLFLARMSPEQADRLVGEGPLKRYTGRTIVDPQALRRELGRIRREGVGTDEGEYLEGSVCLAVPVTDAQGRMIATIAVHGPAPRMTLKKGRTYLPQMMRAAQEMAGTFAEP